jgi:hypothetical protein
MKKLVLENGDTKKLLIFVGVILFLVLGSVNRNTHLTDPPEVGASGHKVLYIISGDPTYVNGEGTPCLSASLTYTNSSGGTQQEDAPGCHSPFEIEVTRASGDPVYISAQMTYETEHLIHVSILVDGKLVQEASSTSTYGVATASGRVQ